MMWVQVRQFENQQAMMEAANLMTHIFDQVKEEIAGSGVKPTGMDFISVLRPKDRKRKKLGKKTMEALENY